MSSRCPRCGTPVEHPRGNPDAVGSGTHTTLDCPGCHTPLIFYSQGDFIQRWQLDDQERRNRKRSDTLGG